MQQREKFSSRLGFILISAGCAIGLGNVYRFPIITGAYGGALFVLFYILFLLILGLPVMAMELAVGRASGRSIASSFDVLEKSGQKWHLHKYTGMAGNYLLMMFYTTISGWMLIYFFKYLNGSILKYETAQELGEVFGSLIQSPVTMILSTYAIIVLCFGVCSLGLQKGVEKITKVMMISLFLLMMGLAIYSCTLPGAKEGLKFYLIPSLDGVRTSGLWTVISAAMGQAFFTLSLGVGGIAIFGSYIKKTHSLAGEALTIIALDTLIAIVAGIMIFPCCFSFGVDPGSGPGLIFISLPNTFAQMAGGRYWGIFFFIFLAIAAFTTVIAVFENLIAYLMDQFKFKRVTASFITGAAVALCAIPCALGFNLWSKFQPLGKGSTILDLEDFIVSQNLLPLGAFFIWFFCVTKYAWGWKNFIAESDTGQGIKFPQKSYFYIKYILPVLIAAIFIAGYIQQFDLVNKMKALIN